MIPVIAQGAVARSHRNACNAARPSALNEHICTVARHNEFGSQARRWEPPGTSPIETQTATLGTKQHASRTRCAHTTPNGYRLRKRSFSEFRSICANHGRTETRSVAVPLTCLAVQPPTPVVLPAITVRRFLKSSDQLFPVCANRALLTGAWSTLAGNMTRIRPTPCVYTCSRCALQQSARWTHQRRLSAAHHRARRAQTFPNAYRFRNGISPNYVGASMPLEDHKAFQAQSIKPFHNRISGDGMSRPWRTS